MSVIKAARTNADLLGKYSISGRVKLDDFNVRYATSIEFKVLEKP